MSAVAPATPSRGPGGMPAAAALAVARAIPLRGQGGMPGAAASIALDTRVRFPVVQRPRVSIVMVTYGAWPHTARALACVAATTREPYEVIVVDNASPDDTRAQLAATVENVTLIANPTNVGFGPACNQGVMAARGEYVVLLNSDAFVHSDWLPPLLATADADATVGMVVARLLNCDGSLQEAGSLLFHDGTTLGYGRGDDPDRPEYTFARDLDYGSAACCLLRRTVFDRVGGFDAHYAPAYYEDVDLCLALAATGFRTVYEPRAVATHVLGGSSPPGVPTALIERNRRLFAERWADVLAERPRFEDFDSDPSRLVQTRDANASPRILFIDDRVPHHDRGSGDSRSWLMLQRLRALYPSARLTLLAYERRDADRYAPSMRARGIETFYDLNDWSDWFITRRWHYDAVIVSRAPNVERFDALLRQTQPGALRAFDVEALYHERLGRMAADGGSPRRARRLERARAAMLAIERRAVATADAVWCVSEEDADFCRAHGRGADVVVVSLAVDSAPAPAPWAARRDVLFFGGFMAGAGSPNEDAVLHLARDILPLLLREEPDLVLHVVGAEPTPAICALHGGRIDVVGPVTDPRAWLERVRVHLVPMRTGAGVQVKLVESMGAGLPFVTTPSGARGLPLDELRATLVGADAATLAQRTLALYRNEALWSATSAALQARAATTFNLAAFDAALVQGMAACGVAPEPRPATPFWRSVR